MNIKHPLTGVYFSKSASGCVTKERMKRSHFLNVFVSHANRKSPVPWTVKMAPSSAPKFSNHCLMTMGRAEWVDLTRLSTLVHSSVSVRSQDKNTSNKVRKRQEVFPTSFFLLRNTVLMNTYIQRHCKRQHHLGILFRFDSENPDVHLETGIGTWGPGEMALTAAEGNWVKLDSLWGEDDTTQWTKVQVKTLQAL